MIEVGQVYIWTKSDGSCFNHGDKCRVTRVGNSGCFAELYNVTQAKMMGGGWGVGVSSSFKLCPAGLDPDRLP